MVEKRYEGTLCAEACKILGDIPEHTFLERIANPGIPEARKQLLFQIVKRRVDVDLFEWVDCCRFALKQLYPERLDLYNCGHHMYSESELYEYDPVKNGANIIKHGMSFHEVVSYSVKFGTLTVPCPEGEHGRRAVIFSDLEAGEGGSNLAFPLPKMAGTIFTLAVAEVLDGRYRFISARRLSERSYGKAMSQAFKGIYVDDPANKQEFVEHCMAIVERHLLNK